jgi:hypothetical protein
MKAPIDSQVLDDFPANGAGHVPAERAGTASHRPPFLATLALVVAAAVLALAIFEPLLGNLDALAPLAGLVTYALGGLLALLGLLLALLALHAARGGRPGRPSSRRRAVDPRTASLPGRVPMRRRWT